MVPHWSRPRVGRMCHVRSAKRCISCVFFASLLQLIRWKCSTTPGAIHVYTVQYAVRAASVHLLEAVLVSVSTGRARGRGAGTGMPPPERQS